MNEAAGRLRVSRRALQELVKRYPHYFSNGRRKLFTEEDLIALVATLRESRPLYQSTSLKSVTRAAGHAKRREGCAMWSEAQGRLAKLRQKRPRQGTRRDHKPPAIRGQRPAPSDGA